MFFIKLLIESFSFALNAITTNKVRTVLSLSGITIGIFSIISVFTVFDSMEMAIKNNLSSLGNNILFVTKWPLIGDANFPWWKYWNRPEPAISELREIQRRTQGAEASAIDFALGRTIKYQGNYVENATVHAVSQDYDKVISGLRKKTKKVKVTKEQKAVRKEAEHLFKNFRAGEKLTTDDILLLQRSKLI